MIDSDPAHWHPASGRSKQSEEEIIEAELQPITPATEENTATPIPASNAGTANAEPSDSQLPQPITTITPPPVEDSTR